MYMTKLFRVFLTMAVLYCLPGCYTGNIKPSEMVGLGAFTHPGQTQIVSSGNPDGTSGGPFTVPGGKVLIITKVIIHPIPLRSGQLQIAFMQKDTELGERTRQTWHVTGNEPTEFDFAPGDVVSSDSQLEIKSSSSNAGDLFVQMYGYLATDE